MTGKIKKERKKIHLFWTPERLTKTAVLRNGVLDFQEQIRFHSHCVKSVQIRGFFIWTEYGEILVSLYIQSESGKTRTRKNSVFGHFSRSVFLFAFLHFEHLKHVLFCQTRVQLEQTNQFFDHWWQTFTQCFRSSCPEVFCKKGVFKNLVKFTAKRVCRSFFFLFQ